MAAPDLTELGQNNFSFDSGDFQLSLEDEFVMARIQNELKAATDIEQLRTGAVLLLQLAVMRQAMIRGLINRLGKCEQELMSNKKGPVQTEP
jgi:hypothetical protein